MRHNPHSRRPVLVLSMIFFVMSTICQAEDRDCQKKNIAQDVTPSEAYSRLSNISKETACMDTLICLSYWDQAISMLPSATEYRSRSQAYMEDLKNRKVIDPEFGRLLSIAGNASNWSPAEKANIRLWNRDYIKRTKLPPDFAARQSEAVTISEAAWEEAREKDDYSIFKPHLQKMIDLNREKARCWGYNEHPYDALLDDFAPGMTAARYDRLFDSIKPRIIELIREINKSKQISSKEIYGGAVYPAALEEKICKNMTAALGYNYNTGILSSTKRHPTTYPIGINDTRITIRFNEKNPEDPILTALHEGGHGIAYQNTPEEYFGTPVGSYLGMDIAEAESRLFENNIGRSRPFWKYWLPRVKEEFSPAMDNVTLDDMYSHMNSLAIGPVRLDADEISYLLHIIIRYEIERDIFDGKAGVDDLPRIWNQKYMDYLGVKVADDREGILQDVHWADGNFGYFPAYALGSLNAAQLEAAMRKDHPDLDQRFEEGDFSVPAAWMKEHVYRFGSIYDTPDLMKMATGKETDACDFMNYLDAKYRKIYGLE